MGHTYKIKIEERYQFCDDISKRKRTVQAIEEINKLSNLPCCLLGNHDKKIAERLFQIGFTECRHNYMSIDYHGNDGMVRAAGYPHDEEKFFITEMNLKTNQYNVLGIKVGSYMKYLQCILESYGYSKIKKNGKYYFEKDDVIVKLIGEERLDNISVEVKTFYLGNMLY